MGDEIGYTQMRPFVIWFGEPVPAFEEALNIVRQADIVAVIGTSLKVYPAADLINYVPENAPIYLIDPNKVSTYRNVRFINKTATEGVKELVEILEGQVV
jgi:NAD-dependent deacetylase